MFVSYRFHETPCTYLLLYIWSFPPKYNTTQSQASTPTVQQLKYELAKAEGAKYEQLLNNTALLSQLQNSNALSNGGGLTNGLTNGLSSSLTGGLSGGISHGVSGDLTNGLSNGITSDFAKSANALTSGTPEIPLNH